MATIRDRYILDIDTGGAESSIGGLRTALQGLVAGISVGAIAGFGKAIIDAGDTITQYENKLRAAGIAQKDLAATFETLRGVAAANRTEFGATVDLFSKLQASSKNLGLDQQGVVESLTNFQVALKAAGADAATADAAIYQFGQAMASGTLQGDEFRSLMEAMGTSMALVAADAGLTSAELKAMASSGELTAETFLKMLNNSTSLKASFDAMQPTIAELETALRQAFVDSGAAISEATGLGEIYANTIKGITRDLQQFAGTTTPIMNESDIELVEKAKEGVYSYGQAIDEINQRISDTYESFLPGGFFFSADEREELRAYRAELELLNAQAQENIERAKAEEEARKAALGPLQDVIDRTKEYTKVNDESTSKLDALLAAQQQAAADIEALNAALGTNAEQYVDINAAIGEAEARHAALGEEITKVRQATEGMTFPDYFADLITNSEAAVERTNWAKFALEDLSFALENGAISQEVYNEALETVNSALGINNEELDAAGTKVQTYAEYWQGLQDTIATTVTNQQYSVDAFAELKAQFDNNAISIDQFKAGLDALGMSLYDAGYSSLAYEDYLKSLADTVENTLAMDGFKQQALSDLKAQFDSGSLSIQEYEAYMRALGETTKSVSDSQERLKSTIDDFKSSAGDRLQRERDSAELAGLSGIEKELRSIELEEKRLAENAKKRIRQQFPDSVNSQEQIDAIKEIDRAMKESIQSRSDLAREIEEQQSTFSYGWEQAYREYAENANNAAKSGAEAFKKATKGMEDSIVGFAKTGKFEWKSFVADMAEQILRSNVQKLIAGLFGGGGGGGSGSGSFSSGNQQRFGGYFAQGGMIPAGKFGVVGESGAEFVSGPAQVTPMPAQSVTYNINAVDALSFRQLVARDPGFIHAVAAQGARTIPGGRR